MNKHFRCKLPLWSSYFNSDQQVVLLLLVLVGAILRIWTAVSMPLWRDEVYIFFTSRDNSLWNLIIQKHWDTAHPPLHSIFLHFWQMVSISPFWLRLPSLIASLITLFLIPVLAVKISRKYKFFPFIFLLFFDLSITQISTNIVVRPYPFFILCMVISIILLLEMVNKLQKSRKTGFYFVLTNTIITFLDYSSIWLFSAYFVFFFFFFLFKPTKSRLSYLFWSLISSAACALVVVPLLFSTLTNSLHLARYINPVKPGIMSYKEGAPLYVYIDSKRERVVIYDASFKKRSDAVLQKNPFPNDTIHIGYNLPPLSLLRTETIRVCPITQKQANIRFIVQNCNSKNYAQPIQNNFVVSPHKRVIDFFIDNALTIVNTQFDQWEVNNYKKAVPLIKNEGVLLEVKFSSLYFTYPPGINISGMLHSGNTEWWKNITRFTIDAQEKNYRITYLDGATQDDLPIFGEGGIIQKVSGSLLFFGGFPDLFDTHIYFLYVIAVLITTQLVHLFFSLKDRSPNMVLFLFIFCIPIVESYLISYYFVPIFLGRNLHLVNLAYLSGLSLLVSLLILKQNVYAKLLAVGFIAVFVLILFVRFPYLYYVDPPYNIRHILSKVNDSK